MPKTPGMKITLPGVTFRDEHLPVCDEHKLPGSSLIIMVYVMKKKGRWPLRRL
jgi:hypothetical protein